MRVRASIALSLLMWFPLTSGLRSVAPRALPGHVVDITARDFFLQAPDTIPAGLTTLRLHVPQGDHIAVLVRLDSGHTMADLLKARHDKHPRPAWIHILGGPGFPPPGGTSNATVVLTPGEYVLLCDVAGPDGVRHVEKGMFHALVVRPAAAASQEQSLPSADAVVKMRDYAFSFSKPLRAGTHILRVVNEGSVVHEFRVTRVLPGHTGREAMAWKPGAPRVDEDLTALVGIVPGAALTTTVDLPRGEYLVFCVGEIDHGMMQIFRVD